MITLYVVSVVSGQCCWFQHPETGYLTPCRYLTRLRSGLIYCKCYNKRNSQIMLGNYMVILKNKKENVICVPRVLSKYDHPGCPYNRGRPMAPWHKKETSDQTGDE